MLVSAFKKLHFAIEVCVAFSLLFFGSPFTLRWVGLFFGPLGCDWTFLWSIELWLDFSWVHWVLVGLFFGPLSFDWAFLWFIEFWLDFVLVHWALIGLFFGPLSFEWTVPWSTDFWLDFTLVHWVHQASTGLDWSVDFAAHSSASFQRALHELKVSLTCVCLTNVSMSQVVNVALYKM